LDVPCYCGCDRSVGAMIACLSDEMVDDGRI
jgi:hypothetical protein